jgi:hypothetical protein
MVLLLGMILVSWSLAIDERGGHKDLRGSGRRSVLPYFFERTELYCTSLSCLSFFFFFPDPGEEASAWIFYNSRPDSYIETWELTCVPEVVETMYNI